MGLVDREPIGVLVELERVGRVDELVVGLRAERDVEHRRQDRQQRLAADAELGGRVRQGDAVLLLGHREDGFQDLEPVVRAKGHQARRHRAHERHDLGNDVGGIGDPSARSELEHPIDQRVAVRRLGFDHRLRVRVRDHLTADRVGQPVCELRVHLDPHGDARVVAPHVRIHVERGVAVEVGRHVEVTIGHREVGDPVDSEAPAWPGLGLVPHDVPVPAPRADGPGLEHPSLAAVGERDRGARTLRLQEREGVGGHGEEDLSAVVVDGRTQDFRVGVGLSLEGDDDGAGGGDQRPALARREERGSQLVVRGLGS